MRSIPFVVSFSLLTFVWFFFLLSPQLVCANDIYEHTFGYSKKIQLDTRTGLRKANMNWNIAASDLSPNILSELSYDNMEIYEAGIDAKAVINKIYSKASVSFGRIVEGKGTDSDYRESDRNGGRSSEECRTNQKIGQNRRGARNLR